MDPRLLALCSAAVGIVYAAGYYYTVPPVPALPPAPAAVIPVPQAPAAPEAAAPAPAARGPKYQEGTFKGYGHEDIGAVEVTVTIKNDVIVDVQIVGCYTRYSQSYIDPLPAEVLVEQSERVATVTGATKSTDAFRKAIRNALDHASL